MNGRKIKAIEGSAIGLYIRSTTDIMPKERDMPPNWNDMRSIVDITELGDIVGR